MFFRKLKVILLAEALYQDVRKYVRREDVYVCPNGIPEGSVPAPRKKEGNKLPHLLFLSNLQESKGVLELLDACKLLSDCGHGFVCDIVGCETAEIDSARFHVEVERRSLNRIVAYYGKRYGEEKEAILRQADIFVFPTYYHNECFPLVLLEAMQQGVPCVTTCEAGIPSIIDDGQSGYIVERRNTAALADRIELLLNNPDLRKEMGEKGYQKYLAQFTLSHFECRMTDILLSLLP